MSQFSTHHWKRWLPIVVLLMILAQLATAAHWHQGEEHWVDCSLCLHASAADDNHSPANSIAESQDHSAQPHHTLASQQPLQLSTAATIRAPPHAIYR